MNHSDPPKSCENNAEITAWSIERLTVTANAQTFYNISRGEASAACPLPMPAGAHGII